MRVSGLPPSITTGAMSPEQKTALAGLTAATSKTAKTLFATELAKTFANQGKSDTYTPQVTTSVATNTRPSVFMPAVASASLPTNPTTSTSSSRSAPNRRQRRKNNTSTAQKL